MRAILAAALLLLSGASHAQIITINENLDTSSGTFNFNTNNPLLTVGTDTYSGSVPGAVLFVGSNAVIGTGTGSKSEVVIYATGTIDILGVPISTANATSFFPSTGAATTAALTGTGTSVSLLGVNSSSVPVFQSGKYPAADGSLITNIAASLIVATGPLSGVGSTRLPSETTFYFDSTYFVVLDSANIKSSVISLATGTAGTGWTRQVLTSGTGATYTTPAGAVQLRINMIAGGGGGQGPAADSGNSTAGTTGGTTSFDNAGTNYTVIGGGGGQAIASSGGAAPGGIGGTGGTGGSSPNVRRFAGNIGGLGGRTSNFNNNQTPGIGACSVFGGCGAAGAANGNNNGGAAVANTGSGGGGATNTSGGGNSGPGGGSGERAEIIINSPAGSYTYTVGGGGGGSVGSASTGGTGGSGVIIVDEIYPSIGPAGPSGTIAVTSATAVSSNTAPSVYNLGVASAASIGFYIPKGGDGAQGIQGNTGNTGSQGPAGVTLNGGWTSASSGSPAQVYLTTATNAVIIQSTLTVQGNAFSVGGSTFTVSGGKIGIGTASPGASLEVNGQSLFDSSATIKGVADGSDGRPGFVGEYVSSVPANSFNFPGDSTFGNCGSTLTLTAGDWDISLVTYISGAGVTGTLLVSGIGTATGNSAAGISYGDNAFRTTLISGSQTFVIPAWRASISSTTVYYCKIFAAYSAGTPSVTASRMSARRVR